MQTLPFDYRQLKYLKTKLKIREHRVPAHRSLPAEQTEDRSRPPDGLRVLRRAHRYLHFRPVEPVVQARDAGHEYSGGDYGRVRPDLGALRGAQHAQDHDQLCDYDGSRSRDEFGRVYRQDLCTGWNGQVVRASSQVEGKDFLLILTVN